MARDSTHREALQEYRGIWAREGARALEALERWSGFRFAVDTIRVEIIDGPSWAGDDRIGMRLSYPRATKMATLVHELGHVVIGEHVPEDERGRPVVDHHAVLFLFLYDVWVELWGEEFAQEQVAVESNRRGGADYEGLWREALRLTAAERAAKLRALSDTWGER